MRYKLITKSVLVRVLPLLFLSGVLLSPKQTEAASCVVTLNWSGGWCSICGGPVGNYACNPPGCNPCGAWGPRTFTDCVPAGNVVTEICATVSFVSCGSQGNYFIALNGTTIGTRPPGGTNCACGSCETWTTCRKEPCPGGFPGYIYGGTNTFVLDVIPTTGFCLSRVVLTITYAPTTPPTPGPVSGATAPCVGSTQTYSVPAVTGATGYTWTVPGGWVINSGQGTTSISVTVGATAGNVCVTADNACGSSPQGCLTVTPVSAPAIPGAITGTTTPCVGASATYNISAVSGASSYTWTVPAGWTITAGQGTTSITVTVGSASGNVCVRSCSSCGCSAFNCLAVTPTPVPAAPGAISGLTSPCSGDVVTYSISGVSGATSYQWTVPAGWTITAGQGTTSITVTAGSTSGNVCVRACNGCGCSGFTCVAVSPGASPATPGAISGPAAVCPGSTMIYSITAVSGATSYTWTIPAGWTLNAGQGTTTISVTAAGAGGTITVQACNSCGCSGIQSLVVTLSSISITPSAVNESCSGGCDGNVSVSVSGGTSPFTYAWSNGCVTSTCTALCAATYNVTVTDAGGCSATGSATILAGPPVVAGFSYNGNQCLAGNSYCFTNTGTTGAVYAWDFGDGVGTSTAENPCYTYTGSGSFIVTQSVTLGACSDATFTIVVVYDSLAASIVGTDATCNGDCDGAANLTVASGQAPFSYAWSNGPTTEDVTGLCAATYDVTVTDANSCQAIVSVVISEPTALTATPSGNNILCNGACIGDATATAGGGTAPYSYNWNDPFLQTTSNATLLCAGTYNVTITDANGCTQTTSQTITEPAAMVLTFTPVDATCGSADGSVCVTVTGGSAPFTYVWDDPSAQTNNCATALFGGGYNVTVTDANSCVITGNTTVNTSASVTASITDSTMVSCNGGADGSATVLAGGGSTPYTYSWDDLALQTNAIAVGLPAGTWTATVLDALGCIATVSVTITEPALLSASILASNDPNCNSGCDGDATVTVSGGSGAYTYVWSPTGGSAATGTALCANIIYTVTVTDSLSCSAADNITLSEPTVLTSSIIGTNVSCAGGSDGGADLTPGGGTSPYNFLWTTGPTSEDLTNITAGTYCVTVTDNQGCTDTSCVTITEATAITVSTTVVDAYCGLPNGSACPAISGGTPPYTYLWDDPLAQTDSCAINLLGGITYNVVITDGNSCTGTAPAVVNDLPPAVAVATVDNNASGFLICDGQATGAMTGGIPPYTYLWDDPLAQTTATATGLCAGTHCVTITDSAGCSASDCITITEPSAIVLVLTGTNLTCNLSCDGTADVAVVGGIPPYTYSWSPGGMTTPLIIGLCANTYVVTVTDNNLVVTVDSIVITEPTAIAIAMNGNDANCNGVCDGDASGALSGGTPPYTYLWDDPSAQTTATAVGLCAATYTLTVTDTNGCIASNSITVSEPVAMILSTTTTAATCGQSDGSATVTVANGVPTFTYSWVDGQTSSTATNLSAGAWQVVVTDADGCIDSVIASVSNTSGPVVVVSDSTDVTCFGACDGDATASASGGTAPYTYAWSPSGQTTITAALLCAGTHIVQVTDATGCTSSASLVIDEPANLVANGTVLSDPNCNGSCDGVATVAVTGGTAPYNYQWDDPLLQTGINATGLCAGSFSVVVTDANGCGAIGTVTLVEPLALSLSISTVDPGCNGGCNGTSLVIASGGVTPYSYTWSNGDNTAQADSLCANTYVITVTDANGCAAIATATIGNPPVLAASILTTQDVACNGGCDGFATVTQSGGTPPYSYSWSDGQLTATATFLCLGTYGVTITDANGCTDTTSATINQPTTLLLSISKTNVLCNGDCNGTATTSVAGGVPPFTYQWDDPLFQTTATADSLCDGVWNVTVTDTSGCSASAFVLITEPNALSIIVASVDSTTCGLQNGGACVNIAGGQFPYYVEWSDPLSTVGTCVNNVFAGVYKVYVLDNNGCFDSLLVPINDRLAATIDSITTTDDNCYGDSIGSATVDSVSGNVGAVTYYWIDFNGDTIASGVGTNTVAGLAGGTYSVTIEDGVTGCLTTEIVVINQPAPLNTAIFPTNIVDVSCNGLCDGSLTVNVSGGTGAYTYSWLPTSSDVTPMADSLCGGQHIVFVSDADGCVDSSLATIIDPPAISVVPTVTDVSCFGANDGIIDLVPTPTGGTPPYAYVWFPSGIAGNVQTATNLSAGTDTVVTTDLRGCSDTTVITVNEPAELIIDTTTTVADFCGTQQGQAIVTPAGGTPAYSYTWGTTPVQVDSTATGLLAGAYNITVSDANACTAVGLVTVPGTPGPVIDSAIVNNVGCAGDSTGWATALVSSGTLPFTYSWDDPQLQTTQTATGLPAGQYICTVTDANGCPDIAIITISEPSPIVVLMFQDDLLICYGDSTQISVVILGGVDPIVRSWDQGLPDSSVHIVAPATTTTYTVSISDANNCTGSGSVTVTVNPPLSITTSGITEICVGQTATLTAYPSSGNGGPYTVIWDDGVTTTTDNVIAGDSSVIQVTPASNTNYTVVVSDGCSLNDTATAYVAISALPDANFYAVSTTGCDITFIDTSKGYTSLSPQPSQSLISLWEWDFGDGTVIGPDTGIITGSPNTSGTYVNPTHNYASPGVYTVTVTVTDVKGCINTLTLTNYITVAPPVASFSTDPLTILKNQLIQFTDLSTGNLVGWSWNFGDTSAVSTTQNPTHTYTDTGSYVVILAVIDADGCVDTVLVTISVSEEPMLFVPNIFEPNSTNPNKAIVLYVSGIGIKSLNFIIYDRWGEKIFENTSASIRARDDGKGYWYGDGWDGTKNGAELSAQVFVYYLEFELEDGTAGIKKGNITLIK
ncbi:MAG TPA: PKD domain-containing protein [Flavobacteriales bacterium]|nr:PKD domain-containing protein [Flavobacteriales bacterium]